ncbi:unnamed protein product [Dovyalis caffra]|uniref:Uncharacterized protein n=1 Tax=Dovyalis caffra TaxID=77055 RepID=A0AAV1SUN8_9ROSI|nr:unnamed protein product [Dovyalis caffra]
MNSACDDLPAVFGACTWPISAMNQSESMWPLGKIIEVSPATSISSFQDVVQIETSHQNPQPVMIDRNESELALEKLALELSVSNITSTPSLLPPLTTLSLNEIVEISHQRFDQNPQVSGMTRSESELALEKFLDELSATASSVVPLLPTSSIVDNENIIKVENPKLAQASALDINYVLKAKLNMACAAAAALFGGSSTHPEDPIQAEQDFGPSPESEIDAMLRKRKVQIRQTISDASSKENSETIEQIDPEEAKRARRLEIDQLMYEHASMASELAKVRKMHHDAIAENEKLKDEIGTLKAKVNKVEENVEQLMKLNPMLILNFRRQSDMQFVSCQASHASSNVVFNLEPNSIQQGQADLDNAPSTSSLHRVANIYFLDDNNVARKPQIDDSKITSTINIGSRNICGNDMSFIQGCHFFG